MLIGLSLFLTFFIMSPVLDKAYQSAWLPYSRDEINVEQHLETGSQPFREFMLGQTRQNDLALFARLAKIGDLEGPEQVPMRVLIPAFMISELKTAFQIGFMIFLPFLVIDLVVASILMAMGMMMLSPMLISLPFKLMLFVLVDGWTLIMGSLISSFGIGGGG